MPNITKVPCRAIIVSNRYPQNIGKIVEVIHEVVEGQEFSYNERRWRFNPTGQDGPYWFVEGNNLTNMHIGVGPFQEGFCVAADNGLRPLPDLGDEGESDERETGEAPSQACPETVDGGDHSAG